MTCTLGGDGAFEVQLRHKLPHWSSYWSSWSSSIFVPAGEEGERRQVGSQWLPNPTRLVPLAEILESPVLSYQLGKLGRDGQRVLRLSWQVR